MKIMNKTDYITIKYVSMKKLTINKEKTITHLRKILVAHIIAT